MAVDFDDGFGEGLRGLPGQIVPDAAFDNPRQGRECRLQ
jgi:hypothetical protein